MADLCANLRSAKFICTDRHFKRCRSLKIVKQRHIEPSFQLGGQTIDNHFHRTSSIFEIHLFDAGLAMNAKPQFGLFGTNSILFGCTWNGACIKRHTDRGDIGNDTDRCLSNRVKISPFLSQSTGDFMNKQSACQPARLGNVWQSNSVVDHYHVDFQTQCPSAFCGQSKVQSIANVILDDQQTTSVTSHGKYRGENRVGGWRCKYIAAHGRRQHALCNKARMCRLVSGSCA